jgi:hypothetical protein
MNLYKLILNLNYDLQIIIHNGPVKNKIEISLFREDERLSHIFEENIDRERLIRLIISEREQILEFPDDDSAKLWFILEYGG